MRSGSVVSSSATSAEPTVCWRITWVAWRQMPSERNPSVPTGPIPVPSSSSRTAAPAPSVSERLQGSSVVTARISPASTVAAGAAAGAIRHAATHAAKHADPPSAYARPTQATLPAAGAIGAGSAIPINWQSRVEAGRIRADKSGVRRVRSESGFTLIEILVVMLILGLLAAIALPAFLNQRAKASDADAKVQVRTAQSAAETIFTDNGRYNGPNGVSVNNLRALEPVLNGADLTVQAATQTGYRVRVGSSTGNWFEVQRNSDSTFEYPCDDPGTGGCPSTGSWAD